MASALAKDGEFYSASVRQSRVADLISVIIRAGRKLTNDAFFKQHQGNTPVNDTSDGCFDISDTGKIQLRRENNVRKPKTYQSFNRFIIRGVQAEISVKSEACLTRKLDMSEIAHKRVLASKRFRLFE